MYENTTMLSRSGKSSPDGKLTQRLDVPVSEDLETGVITLAAIAGVSKAEWVRSLLERTVFGELMVLRRISCGRNYPQVDESRTEE